METKTIKQRKAMLTNMETHLNFKKFKCKIISEKIDEQDIPTSISGKTKTFNFHIKILNDKLNKNGNPQVQLLLQTEKENYITLEPQTNGQIIFMMENYIPGIIKIPQKNTIKK